MKPFPVSAKKQLELQARMQKLGVKEEELQERFVRSRGAGGQNVNKLATCVVLRHGPSGIEVRCQRERTQGLNRFLARRLLVEKLDAQLHKQQSDEAKRIAKIRKQKRKRSKRAKEKMLEQKHQQSKKKDLRKPVKPPGDE